MSDTNAHIIAMTGSYFRGDNIPVLLPHDEIKFTKVTYNYYEQLNGYKYLKTLGIGYHFTREDIYLRLNKFWTQIEKLSCIFQTLMLANQQNVSMMK